MDRNAEIQSNWFLSNPHDVSTDLADGLVSKDFPYSGCAVVITPFDICIYT